VPIAIQLVNDFTLASDVALRHRDVAVGQA
jgi:hypothetical protein